MEDLPHPLPQTPAWQALREQLQLMQRLRSIQSLLSWDQETGMPTAGNEHRAKELEWLSEQMHATLTCPKFGETLLRCGLDAEDSTSLALLREVQRDRDRLSKLPADLHARLTGAVARTQHAWVEARQSRNAALVLPKLEELLDLKRQEAACYGGDAYDALLDSYEPGAKSADLSRMFQDLEPHLVDLLGRIKSVSPPKELPAPFDVHAQADFGKALLSKIGFDFEAGRLDISAHPFTMGLHPQDVRLTARYQASHLEDGLFSVLHEGGHGLYEQGLRADLAWSPLGEACSLGIHESQSRFWENHVGRSLAFWEAQWPLVQAYFPQLHSWKPEAFWRAVNRVEPGLIRVDADEVCYNLHVMLRFELEQALLRKDLSLSDLEGAWNERFEQLLGLEPTHAFEGFLQDVHWSAGLWGYFPTYTVGNLVAAQLAESMEAELGSLDTVLRGDQQHEILAWLRLHVHRHGRALAPMDLVRSATGKDLDSGAFIRHLEAKVRGVYGL